MMKFAITLLLTLSAAVFAQDRVSGGGNGGDFIRMKFLSVGESVLKYYQAGFESVKDEVDPDKLRAVLNIGVVETSKEQLYDNKGNPVDAIGEWNKIILYTGSEKEMSGWYGIFKREEMVETLVLHEMLRAAGYNDDNYVYSAKILKEEDSAPASSRYALRRCHDAGFHLRIALQSNFFSPSFEEEKQTLVKAANFALNLIGPKHHFYFRTSLEDSLKRVEIFPNLGDQVIFLRKQLFYALNDLEFLDNKIALTQMDRWSFDGNLKYVYELLGRIKVDAFHTKTSELELAILETGIERSVAFLRDRPSSQKAPCALVLLEAARAAGSAKAKRDLIGQARLNLLNNNCEL